MNIVIDCAHNNLVQRITKSKKKISGGDLYEQQ